MKKFVSNLGLFCFLLVFAANGAIASDAVPTDKPEQAHQESKIMRLTELMQKLEAANPWSVEKVSEALGVELTLVKSSNEFNARYIVKQFIYGGNLIFNEVEFRFSIRKNRMSRLILDINKNATCFTRGNLEKIYPDLRRGSYYRSVIYYGIERPWGRISFEFESEHLDCLNSIIFIPEGM
jgi:hypothetical protein